MRAKLVCENIGGLFKPKSKENIIKDLSNLTKEKKGEKLIEASYAGRLDIVKLLIEAGADINIKNNYGVTSLMLASEGGYKEIVKLLIEASADINAKNIFGDTALMYAYENNHKEIIDLLKRYGAKE